MWCGRCAPGILTAPDVSPFDSRPPPAVPSVPPASGAVAARTSAHNSNMHGRTERVAGLVEAADQRCAAAGSSTAPVQVDRQITRLEDDLFAELRSRVVQPDRSGASPHDLRPAMPSPRALSGAAGHRPHPPPPPADPRSSGEPPGPGPRQAGPSQSTPGADRASGGAIGRWTPHMIATAGTIRTWLTRMWAVGWRWILCVRRRPARRGRRCC